MNEFFDKYQIKDEIVAVGVSGGADSLALALRLNEADKKIVALTVDHNLRPSSRKEAEYVASLMQKYKIEHHILTWLGDKPKSGIEEEAREKRYQLMFDWCKKNNVKTLAIGHHLRDQAETFLLRLQRGSGLDGLCCMQEVSKREEINIIRPQLNDSPEYLKKYLEDKDIAWIEDESNQCDDFLRVKIRKLLPELEEKIGLSVKRLAETTYVLARTRNYLQFQTNKFIQENVKYWQNIAISVSFNKVLELHPEMAFRILAVLIRKLGKKDYIPESIEILRLIDQINAKDFKGCTLGGCEIFKAQKKLWIVPEIGHKQILSKDEWDNCLQDLPQYAKASLPYKVRRAIYNDMKKNKNGKE